MAFAAFFNVVAVSSSTSVWRQPWAKVLFSPGIVGHPCRFGALVGAITWNVITWIYGIPSSSSHALIGGIVGAGDCQGRRGCADRQRHLEDRGLHLRLSLLGFLLGSLMMVLVAWIFRRASPNRVDKWFRRLQWFLPVPTAWVTAATMRKRPSVSSGCC